MSGATATHYSGGTKSPEAFRTISEVSIDLDVPQHVLRFWESRFAQIRPIKRAGGRRYYRPEDVDLLRGIRALLYSDGLTIRGVQKILRERGLRYVAEIGRGKAALLEPARRDMPGSREDHEGIPADGEAVRAYNALARVHADVMANAALNGMGDMALDETRRVKLEILLAELLQMKARLRAAMPATR